ncbi:MAG: enoyl-CoA hydratase-related protein, partial [Pigmentiphaga sp.]
MDTNLQVRRQDGILYITIAREDRLNALDRASNAELARLLDDFEHDSALRVAILTGAGRRAFCSG